MPPNHFESEVESFLEGSHGDRTHIKRADHHTVTPLCGTLLGGFTLARISGCRGVVGFKVATSLRPVREVFRPAWLGVCVSAKKFAQRTENTPKVVFLGLLGEFCRAYRHRDQASQVTRCPTCRKRRGFCTT